MGMTDALTQRNAPGGWFSKRDELRWTRLDRAGIDPLTCF